MSYRSYVRWHVATLGAALFVAAVPPAAAAPPDAPPGRAVALRGHNVFRTSTSASVLVQFPRVVDSVEGFDVSYEGRGRIYGFVMREISPQGDGEIVSTTIGRCDVPACNGRGEVEPVGGFGVGRTIAGTWRLYMIADGRPVKVTLTLDDVAGSTYTVPTAPARVEMKTLTPRIQSAGDTTYSAGDFTKLDAVPDFASYGIWIRGARHVGTALGDCVYYDGGNPDPPTEAAFVSGCPTSEFKWTRIQQGDAEDEEFVFGLNAFGPVTGIGGWFATSASSVETGAVAVFLAY